MLTNTQIIIEKSKITDYLLVKKEKNDKSKFLNNLGYFLENWQDLEFDLREMIRNNEMIFDKKAPTGGDLFRIKGYLKNFGIITIWLFSDNKETFRFITLYPNKEQ